MQLTPKTRKVNRVFIHCSASDRMTDDDVSVIKKWHTSPDPKDKSKPWSDVGYHFFIKQGGTLQQGRNIEVVPAAQEGNNTGTIAICCAGLTTFSEAQFKSLRELCHAIKTNLPDVTFHGHCEVSSKTCPVFDYRKVLNLDSLGRIRD